MDLEYVGAYVCPADLEKPKRTSRSTQRGGADSDGAGPASGAVVDVSTAALQRALRRVQYSQHGARAEFDCEEGQCPFEEGAAAPSGLVAYVGLFSHAMYPRASILWVRLAALTARAACTARSMTCERAPGCTMSTVECMH